MFKKFKNRKYLFFKPGESNLKSYDLKLLLGMFFANLSLTVVAIMYIGSYLIWTSYLDSLLSIRQSVKSKLFQKEVSSEKNEEEAIFRRV